MRRIAIINQKGGVGKTTTAVNLAAALAECGQRVCVIDLDPQAHATTHLGIEPDGKSSSMYDVLIDNRPLAEVRRKVGDNLWVAASDINLAAAEVELAGVVGREVILRDLLLQDEGAFRFRVHGLRPVAGRADAERPGGRQRGLHPASAALPGAARHGQAAGDDGPGGQAHQPGPQGDRHRALACTRPPPSWPRKWWATCRNTWTRAGAPRRPWAKARIFSTRIRRNIKLAECPSFGKSIFAYAPSCHGAEDYAALAQEVLGASSSLLSARVELNDRGQAHVLSIEGSGVRSQGSENKGSGVRGQGSEIEDCSLPPRGG